MKLIIILFLGISFSVYAQTFEWVNTNPLDIQTNPVYLHCPSAIDNYGNPVTARLINSRELFSTAYYGDISIEKRNSSGSFTWGDTIYGKADVSELILDGENNVVCYGTFIDTIRIDTARLINPGPGLGSFILKLDSTGNMKWLKDGAAFISVNGAITALAFDGVNILLGTGDYPVAAKILTLNPDGELLSEINETNVATIGDIKKDLHGNLWVTGFTFSGPVSFNGKDTTAPFTYTDYVVKYNSTGTPLDIKFIQDVTVQFFRLATDDSGNAYLAGNLLDSTSFGNIHANGPQWVYDYFVTKMDPDGNFIWLNEIPQGNAFGDAFMGNSNFLSCSPDGQTYITGAFRGQINFNDSIALTPPLISNDIFALSYNSAGEIQWAKSAGGSSYNQGSGVITDRNGNNYLSGLVSDNFIFDTISGTGGNYNLYIAKLAAENSVTANNGNSSSVSTVDNFELNQNYPNPFNPSTTIKYTVSSSGIVTLKVYDILGKETAVIVNEYKSAGNYEVRFDASELAAGVYFYRLQTGNTAAVKKMILLK